MTEASQYQYGELSVGIELLTVVPGREKAVCDNISLDADGLAIYKAIGGHDVAVLTAGKSPSKKTRHYRDILSHCSFKGLPFTTAPTDSNLALQVRTIAKAPLAAILLLKLSSQTTLSDGLLQVARIAKDCAPKLDSVPLRLLGQCEVGILVGVKSHDINDLFWLVSKTRNDSSFSSSSTLLLVNYQLIKEDRLDTLQGQVAGEIRITCPTAREGTLRNVLTNKKAFHCWETLGAQDLSVLTKGNIDASALLAEVIAIRTKLSPGTVLSTSTQLGWVASHGDAPSIETVASEHINKDIQMTLDKCFGALERVEKKSEGSFINGLTRAFLMQAGRAVSEPYTGDKARQFAPFLTYQVLPLLELYANELETGKDAVQSEKDLFTLVHYGNGAFAQFLLPESLSQFPFALPDGHYGGVNAVLEASHKFIRQLYGQVHDSQELWSGTVFFSQFHSFGLYPAEIISFSAESLTKLVNRDTNWLTVTHEVSHSYWTRLNVFEHKGLDVAKYGKRQRKIGIREIATGEGKQYGYVKPDEDTDTFKDMLWEWFAHWFDYRHFYARNLDLYLWAIWSSWLRLPLVRQNLREYFVRTFMVFLVEKGLKNIPKDELHRVILEEESITYLRTSYDELLQLLDKLSPIGYNSACRKQAEKMRSPIVKLICKYVGYVSYFEYEFQRPELRSPDVSSPDVKAKVREILQGRSLAGETNVVGIMLGLLDHFRVARKEPEERVTMALIDTLLLSADPDQMLSIN